MRQAPDLSQRVERPVHRNPVRPGAELGLATICRQRPKDLNPHLLRDVLSLVRVADQAPYDGVHVRGMLNPKGSHGPLVTIDCAPDQ
jgi:hypothetical protein